MSPYNVRYSHVITVNIDFGVRLMHAKHFAHDQACYIYTYIHLEVKGLTRNYCIIINIQKVISVHKFIQQILKCHDKTDFSILWTKWPHPFLTMSSQKNFWSTFYLSGLVSKCKKSDYFIDFFCRYGWLKNSAIWLAENFLAHIWGTKIFPNMGFV